MNERLVDVPTDFSNPSANTVDTDEVNGSPKRRHGRVAAGLVVALALGGAGGYYADHVQTKRRIAASENIANTAVQLVNNGITGIKHMGTNANGDVTALISSDLSNPKACTDVFTVTSDFNVFLPLTNTNTDAARNGIRFHDHRSEIAAFDLDQKINGKC